MARLARLMGDGESGLAGFINVTYGNVILKPKLTGRYNFNCVHWANSDSTILYLVPRGVASMRGHSPITGYSTSSGLQMIWSETTATHSNIRLFHYFQVSKACEVYSWSLRCSPHCLLSNHCPPTKAAPAPESTVSLSDSMQ